MCSRGGDGYNWLYGKGKLNPNRKEYKKKSGLKYHPKGSLSESWESDYNDMPGDYLYPGQKREVSTVLCPHCTSHDVSEVPDTMVQFFAGKKKCMTCGEIF